MGRLGGTGAAFAAGYILSFASAQVTWGPLPQYISDTDDLSNQVRVHELLRRASQARRGLNEETLRSVDAAIAAEIATFRERAQKQPSMALAVGMAKYYYSWYGAGTTNMDVEHVEDAANHLYLSIQFSACDRPDLPMEAFMQRMCAVRWPYMVMLYSELGRDFAGRYLTEQAATALERAVGAFDAMKRLPYYASLTHWQSPYDINFNEAWFPGAKSHGAVWDKNLVPLAAALEGAHEGIAAELAAMVQSGAFEKLAKNSWRGEGKDTAPEGGYSVVELAAHPEAARESGAWASPACQAAPGTCALLAGRPELQGCAHAGAALVRLKAGTLVKPHFGAAPSLRCQVPLRADPGARMSVGNRTVTWKLGQAVVYDDTFIRQDWHAGVKGEHYALEVVLCHPCDASQRAFYGGAVGCGAEGGPTATAGAAAAAAAPAAAHASAGAATAGASATAPMAAGGDASVVEAPFAAAALWAASLPALKACNAGISESCPPDTQHGGANPLSALNTWNYALNNLRAAILHARVEVGRELQEALASVQGAIQEFFGMPALDRFGAIVSSALQIFEAVRPWLQQQPPARVAISGLPAQWPADAPRIPSDGRAPGGIAFRLSNGQLIPAIGFGTWKLEGKACYDATLAALQLGIRHFDTAEAYGNEAEIGRAWRASGVPREELFIATKVTSVALGMAEPQFLETVFAGQLQSLQTDYVDVYMLHAPPPGGLERLRIIWAEMERMYDMGRVRSLGVSNFGVAELEELWNFARIKPVYAQNIFKVYKPGEQIHSGGSVGLLDWARQRSVTVVGYSVINSWPHLLPPLEDPHVLAVAKRRGRTPSQVLHRWVLQHGAVVIPKASSPERIRENAGLLDFELSPADMALLDGLATLSESTQNQALPKWTPDVFGLR
eukprot:TRINITY_DN46275_c0_g1_i1.p1 TRINITY_DN46275_c0_g1~~TRINITY_DN46275_c0_g1_i1.p1  ORF type:complete len:900 (-),score=220.08 TRINITY_DN46275_c0_g1_i1:126-2825(-)